MLDGLRGLFVFAHVAETRSFSRAAQRLGVTTSAVSKQISQLEAELAVQLIVRTTRQLVLTEAGQRVYAACARIAGDVDAAREAARSEGAGISGKLRVTAPATLGSTYVVPAVTEFMAMHPDVTFDLLFDDAYVDLVAERVDVALRVGGLSDQSLISRRVADVEQFIAAAPSYLTRYGEPRSPAELSGHEWIVHGHTVTSGKITLRKGHRAVVVNTSGRLASNNGPTILAAALNGQGLVMVPDFEVAALLHAGSLVRVLSSWQAEPRALHLVFPPRRHVLGRVRAFAAFLNEKFRDPPWRNLG